MDNIWRNERGYVLVVIAGVLVILLGFAALAVDVGIMYSAHTAAQRAADAGALSGAYTFTLAASGASDTQLEDAATAAAKTAATKNTILGTFLTDAEIDVSFPNGVGYRLIEVDVTHTIPTFFAGVLGSKLATVSVKAYAEASEHPTGDCCVKPWFIPNTILATTVAPLLDPCSTCPATGDGTGYNLVSFENPLGSDLFFVGANVLTYTRNQTAPFRVKPGNPQNALGPGNFFAIQLSNDPNQSGGDVYRDNISYCPGCDNGTSAIHCGDSYSVKTGNMIGPTKQGVEVLLTDNPDTWWGFDSNDLPTYNNANGPHISRQTVLAPVWDTCSTICVSGMKLSGTNVTIKVVGFAVLFISEIQGDDVLAYLVDVKPCYGSTPGAQTGPLAVPLRLVRIE